MLFLFLLFVFFHAANATVSCWNKVVPRPTAVVAPDSQSYTTNSLSLSSSGPPGGNRSRSTAPWLRIRHVASTKSAEVIGVLFVPWEQCTVRTAWRSSSSGGGGAAANSGGGGLLPGG